MQINTALPATRPSIRATRPQSSESPDSFVSSSSGNDGSFRGPRLILGAAGVATTTAIGYGLGSAASIGGFGGAVVGGITGLISGTIIAAPMGNGKGMEGLLYPAAGAVLGVIGGAVVGAMGGNPATYACTAAGLGTGLTMARGALFS